MSLPEAWPSACRRVVFVGTRLPAVSGGSTYVVTMSRALRQRGVDVEHVTLVPGTQPEEFATFVVNPRPDLHSGPVLRGGTTGRGRLRGLALAGFKALDRAWQARRLRRHVASYGPETALVLTHVRTKQVLDESGWRKTAASPVLVGQHHSQFETIDLYADAWMRPAMLRHFADLDAFTALSEDDARRFAEILPVPCRAISNPAPAAPPVARDPRPLAVALARYSSEKDLDVMVRCFARATDPVAAPDLAHWRLELHGEGPMAESLARQVADLGVEDRVRLCGPTDDVYGVLRHASVNLLTSSTEGFGMSVLEAATAAVTSLVFDCSPGLRALVTTTGGALVPNQDESAYVDALRRALRDPDDLARRGRHGLQAASAYHPDAVLERWAELLAEAYGDRGLG